MSVDLVRTLTGNLKLAGVAIGAVALFGGTATTVALVDQESPNEHANEQATTATEDKDTDADEAAEAADDAKETESEGTRPTDTHGYCVSKAVAAAHAAGKTGADVAAAAHSCPKPDGAAAAQAKAAAKKAAKAAERKAAQHGKS